MRRIAVHKRLQATLLIGLVCGLMAAGLAPPPAAGAQAGARVYLASPGGRLSAGQPATVDVLAEGVSNLYGAEIHLRFDPAAVRLEDADPDQEGAQLRPGSLLGPARGFIVANRVDNQAGTAVFAVTLVNPAPAVDGSGPLAHLTLVPLRPGTLRVDLEAATLVTRDLESIAVARGSLEAQVQGEAATAAGGEPAAIAPLAGRVSVPVWALALVALLLVSIPLAGAWFLFARRAG
jgi:hypothetical protein